MPTAEQEAWIANFSKDLEKMAKEFTNELNKYVPKDNQFQYIQRRDASSAARHIKTTNGNTISEYEQHVKLTPFFTPNEKIKWQIQCEFNFGSTFKRILIPVSHNDYYTKNEIKRAEKSILVKSIEFLEKSS